MEMKRSVLYILFVISVLAAAVQQASAQNLDPTVVVSREYEGKLMEAHKPKIGMEVPDSVLRFDLDFDYSVSESPYKGSYDFEPYVLDMRPALKVSENERLYLNLGAGFRLHPELDVVWSPFAGSNAFRMNAYAHHRSYIGPYWMVAAQSSPDGVRFDRLEDGESDSFWKGADLVSRAGVDGRFDWKKGAIGFDLGYYGLVQQENRVLETNRSFNAVDASLYISSKDKADAAFGYSADIDYRYGGDALEMVSVAGTKVRENLISSGVSIFASFKKGQRMCLDLGYDVAGYSGYFVSSASLINVHPHYKLSTSFWEADFGLKFPKVLRGPEMSGMYKNRVQALYPDVKVSFKGIPSMHIYVHASGGAGMNTYSSLLSDNRRLTLQYAVHNGLLDLTDERLNAVLGIEGQIAARFSYALKGGYVRYAASPLPAIYSVSSGADINYFPGIAYVPYEKTFAGLNWRLDTERVDFCGAVEYVYCLQDGMTGAFLPASVTGDVAIRYNWINRIYAGVSCAFSTDRKGSVRTDSQGSVTFTSASIPGYADLGVEMEYLVNRRMSVWLKGGNLLGMTVQRSILYAEKGPCLTLGLSLHL